MADDPTPAGIDPTRPSAARMYDYFLGGDHHLEVDRIAAKQVEEFAPQLKEVAWANRGFHQRATAWLAVEAEIDQFVDIGSGLPTQNNTHDVIRPINPLAKVVYVDNDPSVAHYSAQLLGPGKTVGETAADASGETSGSSSEIAAFVPGDLRDPDALLAKLREHVDFERPVGLLLTAVLHFISDEADPWGLVARYVDALPSGSYLVLSHGTADKGDESQMDQVRTIYSRATDLYVRTRSQVSRFFEGLELEPPYPGAPADLTYVGLWGAEDPVAADDDQNRWFYVGVARKP